MLYTLACKQENLEQLAEGPHCSGGWILVQLPEQFNIELLDPQLLGVMFSVGFGVVTTCMLLGIGARTIINFIKNS